jgi:ParB family transcriptional regulator, chromosome partitioning protein
MPLQLDDLAALDAPTLSTNGQPLMLPVESIDEDPEQPRREFDANALHDLAETIRERGVRQPISVRPDLQQAGRWVLNFGARRLRASKLAGLMEIPAFIDTTADSYDQVIENEQREGLMPLELALFVQKRLAAGDNQAEIAKRLGKSRQYVTLATALIEAPDWLLDAYRQGRCKGMTELYELRRLHGEHPQYIEAWTSDRESITRDGIAAMRAELSGTVTGSARPGVSALLHAVDAASATEASTGSTMPAPDVPPKPHRQSNRSLHVEMDGQDYQLVVSVAPRKVGHLYVRPLTGGPRLLAPASSLKLRGFVSR